METQTTETAPPPLPDLHQSVLEQETVDQLFRDIAECAEVLEVIPKFAPRDHVADRTVTLAEGEALLRSGGVLGLQLRYRYQDAEWWDVLMRIGQRVRLVRIKQEFAAA